MTVDEKIEVICTIGYNDFDRLVERIYPQALLLESGISEENARLLAVASEKRAIRLLFWHFLILALSLFLVLSGSAKVSLFGVSVEFNSSLAAFLVIPLVATTAAFSGAYFYQNLHLSIYRAMIFTSHPPEQWCLQYQFHVGGTATLGGIDDASRTFFMSYWRDGRIIRDVDRLDTAVMSSLLVLYYVAISVLVAKLFQTTHWTIGVILFAAILFSNLLFVRGMLGDKEKVATNEIAREYLRSIYNEKSAHEFERVCGQVNTSLSRFRKEQFPSEALVMISDLRSDENK